MIKVVEAISDTNIGGAGILLLNRLKHTDKKIFHTTVLLPEGSGLIRRFKEMNIDTYTVPCAGDKSFDVKALRAYYRAIKSLHPDILNSHGSLNSRIAATIVGVPIRIYTRHCVYPLSKIYSFLPVRYLNNQAANWLSHKIIAVAYAAEENLIQMGIDKSKICVIINGAEALCELSPVDKQRFKKKLGMGDNKNVVTICARLEKCKGHECFLRAAAELCKKNDDYRFLVIGDGSQKITLKRLCHSLEIEDKVIFTGFVNDVSPFMSITDVNVNCSIGTETSSLALSEGMSLGIPSVVSDYGGNPYMVKHGVNGYVYKSGDYKQLADYVISVKNNREKLAEESLRRYKNELNAKSMTEKTQQLYVKLYKKYRHNTKGACL